MRVHVMRWPAATGTFSSQFFCVIILHDSFFLTTLGLKCFNISISNRWHNSGGGGTLKLVARALALLGLGRGLGLGPVVVGLAIGLGLGLGLEDALGARRDARTVGAAR